MAKKRSKEKRRMPAAAEAASPEPSKTKKKKASEAAEPFTIGGYFASKGVRETIESVAIAFILAFLFRTFEAEAFVIPTGSMAETLRGRHKDLPCEECGYQHIAGGSEGNVDRHGQVVGSTCPMCRNVNRFEPDTDEEIYYTGDRILVSKFVYDLQEPERWDVVVFKFPFNAKQNYIKRLVGKPNETLMIAGGDLWTRPLGSDGAFTIARKPPAKLTAMMQTVHDTHFVPQRLSDAGWPSRWQPQRNGGTASPWTSEQHLVKAGENQLVRSTYHIEAGRNGWIRYRHHTPHMEDWKAITDGDKPLAASRLITDFYGYNTMVHERFEPAYEHEHWEDPRDAEAYGLHWVGDLAVEADVQIESDSGSVMLDLVEAGTHYRCSIDVATGTATLTIIEPDGTSGQFSDDAGGDTSNSVAAATKVRKGSYRLKFANVDNQLTLWVDGSPVAFDGLTTFVAHNQPVPHWSDSDPGDLAPAGVGSEGAALTVDRLRVLRDVYYIAVKSPRSGIDRNGLVDYDESQLNHLKSLSNGDIRKVLDRPEAALLENPELFADMFGSRRTVEFDLGEDEFFTLGDNSPQSQDARIWDPNEHFFDRQYMLGKALFIYWPHATGPLWLPNPWDGLRLTFPITPNFSRMGFVR